jgi:hypothetical protein
MAGCLESAKPSELSCTSDQFCPSGYVCVGARSGVPGSCQKPNASDAAADAPVGLADGSDSDGLDDEDGARNHGDLATLRDGQALAKDAAQVQDQAVDVPVVLDAASDVQSLGNLGFAPLLDTPI